MGFFRAFCYLKAPDISSTFTWLLQALTDLQRCWAELRLLNNPPTPAKWFLFLAKASSNHLQKEPQMCCVFTLPGRWVTQNGFNRWILTLGNGFPRLSGKIHKKAFERTKFSNSHPYNNLAGSTMLSSPYYRRGNRPLNCSSVAAPVFESRSAWLITSITPSLPTMPSTCGAMGTQVKQRLGFAGRNYRNSRLKNSFTCQVCIKHFLCVRHLG